MVIYYFSINLEGGICSTGPEIYCYINTLVKCATVEKVFVWKYTNPSNYCFEDFTK